MKKVVTTTVESQVILESIFSPELVVLQDRHDELWMVLPEDGTYRWIKLSNTGIKLTALTAEDWRRDIRVNIDKYAANVYVFESFAELTTWVVKQL